jgi:hypothetical protein
MASSENLVVFCSALAMSVTDLAVTPALPPVDTSTVFSCDKLFSASAASSIVLLKKLPTTFMAPIAAAAVTNLLNPDDTLLTIESVLVENFDMVSPAFEKFVFKFDMLASILTIKAPTSSFAMYCHRLYGQIKGAHC